MSISDSKFFDKKEHLFLNMAISRLREIEKEIGLKIQTFSLRKNITDSQELRKHLSYSMKLPLLKLLN